VATDSVKNRAAEQRARFPEPCLPEENRAQKGRRHLQLISQKRSRTRYSKEKKVQKLINSRACNSVWGGGRALRRGWYGGQNRSLRKGIAKKVRPGTTQVGHKAQIRGVNDCPWKSQSKGLQLGVSPVREKGTWEPLTTRSGSAIIQESRRLTDRRSSALGEMTTTKRNKKSLSRPSQGLLRW